MRGLTAAVTLGLCLALPALADAPAASLRPLPRPMAVSVDTQVVILASLATTPANPRRPLPRPTPGAPERPLQAQVPPAAAPDQPIRLRPRARPASLGASDVATAAPQANEAPASFALLSVPRPRPRPAPPEQGVLEQIETVAAVRILPGKSAVIGRQGSVCGDPAIRGEVLPPLPARLVGCGIDAPVSVTSVSGVVLSEPVIVDCPTAQALNAWVDGGLKPAFDRSEVVGLRIAGSYSCRPRNNVRGAAVSEHGRGKAVDIAAIVTANGTTVSVAEDWRRPAGKPMKTAYRAACGTFGTTLGPDADSYHRDHMHFDTARQRGGAYCR